MNAGRLARDLIALPPGQRAARIAALRERPAAESGGLLVALRKEASGYYHADAAEARRIAAIALEVAETGGGPLARGWAERTLAEALLFSGRMRAAEAAYGKAARAWRAARADGLLGQLLVGRIHVLTMLGRMADVARTAREAERLLTRAGDRAYLAKLAMNLGSIHFQRDEHALALTHYLRAAEIFARLGIRDEAVIGLEVNRAVVLAHLDRDSEALGLFGRLESECARRGYDLLGAQVKMNTAFVHALRGDFDLALALLARATGYFRETTHPAFLGNCLVNRAEIYQQLRLHADALPLVTEAAAWFAGEDLRTDRALALAQSAWTHLGLRDPAGALRTVREAERLFAREKNPSRVALMKLIRAEGFASSGRRAAALRQARLALDAFRALGLRRWEAACEVFVARVDRRLAPGDRASCMRALLARLPQRAYPLERHGALEQLGLAQEEVGAPRQAARTYARAVNGIETLRLHAPTEDAKIGFLADKTYLYDRLLRLELARAKPAPDRLFEWMERARAQALWDRVRLPVAGDFSDSGSARPRDPGGRVARESVREAGRAGALRRRLSWLHARISRLELGTAAERRRADELRRELGVVEKEWTRSRRALAEARVPDVRADARRAAVPSRRERAGRRALQPFDGVPLLDALARTLPDGTGFMSYHLGEDFALALAVTRAGVWWRPLAGNLRARLNDLCSRLDFQWAAASLATARGPRLHPMLRTATDGILREAYALLWRPLEQAGLPSCRNWVISPHGPAHRVPFAALLDGDEYLVDRYRLSFTPGARNRFAAPRRRPPRRAFLAGAAGPGLAAVTEEVASVRARLRGWDVTVDRAPTRAALERAVPRSGLIHLAAHGSLRGDNPAFSFIQLADGPLFVHDLADYRLPGSTVVLTACSSGQGVALAGDEWIGLARGFLSSGAATVVASLWPIHDEATRELMDRFYRALLPEADRAPDMGDPAQALAEAMRETKANRLHPWQWAAFAVAGR